MLRWIFILSVLGDVTSYDDGNGLETTDGLFEGDILIPTDSEEFRNVIIYAGRMWPNGIVPYEMDESYEESQKLQIHETLRYFMEKTQCVKFRPRENDTNYVYIKRQHSCSSYVGMMGGRQVTKLADGCVAKRGIILHEMMHVLGFLHEHTRPDRDQYIEIQWRNIKPTTWWNFRLMPEDSVNLLNMTYDYSSLMHYGESYFAKNKGVKTIIPKQKNVNIGQRHGFSRDDIIKIKKLYEGNCYE